MNNLAETAVFVGVLACVAFSLLLMMTGSGDHAESYRTWIIAASIILGAGVIAVANTRRDG